MDRARTVADANSSFSTDALIQHFRYVHEQLMSVQDDIRELSRKVDDAVEKVNSFLVEMRLPLPEEEDSDQHAS
jgi:hypothetical protein